MPTKAERREADSTARITIWNKRGEPHKCPPIVAKEILAGDPSYTDDPAAARGSGGASAKPEPEPESTKPKVDPLAKARAAKAAKARALKAANPAQ